MSSGKLTRNINFIWCLRIALLLPLCWYLYCLLPTGNGATFHDLLLPPGSGIKKLAVELKQNGLIRSTLHFTLMTRLRGEARRLKSGEYRLNDGMSAGDILTKIVNGDVDVRRFTVPEGYSIYQAAELSDQQGLFKRDDFLAACRDQELMRHFGVNGESLEGYLFPATYTVGHATTARQLVSNMVEQFFKEYSRLDLGGKGGQLSRQQIVTLASMVEKEAKDTHEKPLIASVFHNRLKIGMPLQSDPTAVYGVRAFSGKVTKKDIERPGPYNTYLNKGLPPGPIGNPGSDALQAVLQPQASSYLYFVARQDGTHQFSNNLEQHNRAVVRYLK